MFVAKEYSGKKQNIRLTSLTMKTFKAVRLHVTGARLPIELKRASINPLKPFLVSTY